MSHITNEQLVLEAIRRKSNENTKTGVRSTSASQVFRLTKAWMCSQERKRVLNKLLKSGTIILTCRRYTRENKPGRQQAIQTEVGILPSFHDDLLGSSLERFYTTTHGEILRRRRGKMIPQDLKFFHEFYCSHFYELKHGLPRELSLQPVINW